MITAGGIMIAAAAAASDRRDGRESHTAQSQWMFDMHDCTEARCKARVFSA